MTQLEIMGESAKSASRVLASLSSEKKNEALEKIASFLYDNRSTIIQANKIDMENGKTAGLTSSLLDRLSLDDKRIFNISEAVKEVASLPDPVGRALGGSMHKNGMRIQKVSAPFGVVGIIYEARPNVTADAAALCIKSGNAVILRGGKEAINTNKTITEIMRKALTSAGLPENSVCLIQDTSRETAKELMRLNKYVDVLIPRGGAGLIKSVVNNSTVPVIETGSGVCHIYVDKSADLDMAANIAFNAKTSRPSVCNAIETILIHKDICEQALTVIKSRLDEKNVEIRGDETVCKLIPDAVPANEDDWGQEYLDYIVSIKICDSIQSAIDHISKYGSGHSECIVTNSYESSQKFLKEIDAAAVYVNASTRFTDGGEFGMGAEIGISTQKLHARGPMGLQELTTMKYLIYGDGQIRE